MKDHGTCAGRRILFSSVALLLVLAANVVLGFTQSRNNAVGQTDASPTHSYAELEKVPESARGGRNPLESDPTAAAAGGKLYQHYCAVCHGNTADGGRKGPSLRAPEVRAATPGMLFWILTNGVVRRGMPVWSRIPEPQRWQIVSYLKSLD